MAKKKNTPSEERKRIAQEAAVILNEMDSTIEDMGIPLGTFLRVSRYKQSQYILLGSNAPGGDEDFEASIHPLDFKVIGEFFLAAAVRLEAQQAARVLVAKEDEIESAKQEALRNGNMEGGGPS